MGRAQHESMRRMHELHAAALWRYVMHLTGDQAMAEDIVQETLCRAWKSPDLLEQDPEDCRAWLFTVARHLVIDDARSARKRHEAAAQEPPEMPAADELDRLFDSIVIVDALESLSVEHRRAIVLAYYGGRSTAELSRELGVAPGTVKSRLHYGMRALRLALDERGVTR